MKRITSKPDGDCTGIGKWFFWAIVALAIGAWVAMAFKSKGQGVGVGALVGAKQPAIVPQLSPAAASVPGVDPGPGDPCEGDTGPTVDLSDSIIVKTSGTAGGAGTELSPLSLTAALAGTGIMATTTNRTVLVRAGTYNAPSGGFQCNLQGTAGSPWLIRAYPGESPRIHGFQSGDATARCMHVGLSGTPSRFVTFRYLRFHNPDTTKLASGNSTVNSTGIKLDYGNDVSFEHCVMDNNFGSGIDHGSPWSGQLTFKYNLAMLNGGNNNLGHGFYLHSWMGFSNIIEGNIFINNIGYGLHCWSSHTVASQPNLHVSNQKITRNISRKSNTLISGGPVAVARQDPNNVANDTTTGNLMSNNVFSAIAAGHRYRFDNNSGFIVRSNYFQQGVMTWTVHGENNQFHDNRFISSNGDAFDMNVDIVGAGNGSGFTLDDNRYDFYGGNGWQYTGTNVTFTDWKTRTAQDAGSTGNTTNPTDTSTFIFQSTVDTNIIHFAIANESAATTQTISFAGYWPNCGTITIRNAGNYDGTPIVNNVAYTGQTFTITMSPQTYQGAVDTTLDTMSASPEFFAGIAVRTPANPTPTQP